MDSDIALKLREIERARQMAELDQPVEPTSSPIDLLAGGLASGAGGVANAMGQMVPRSLAMMARDEAKKSLNKEVIQRVAKNLMQKKGEDVVEAVAEKPLLEAIKEVKPIASWKPLRGQGKADGMGNQWRRDMVEDLKPTREAERQELVKKQFADVVRKQFPKIGSKIK